MDENDGVNDEKDDMARVFDILMILLMTVC